ncbi:mannitol dehydrogenase family protein [Saccharopolyspora gloriosae]|uniref:mannitol dehydrogenase family protein n=1 Tax=Saccharopolyspora gloriosae TaxID=455344 RepID=UPI001FB606FD|nr:mannitol dehydrogenase family protein [Saccharopolyspora gloriosae]
MRLNRATEPAPVRAVHLGLGGFHRAHQAWYTAADPEWGIAAYTFRSTELPAELNAQRGLYSLLVRGCDDPVRTVASISRAHAGAETEQWLADLSVPEVAVVTLTVTEAAYRVPQPGQDSAISRLVAGLRARFRASAAPITLVPCDNVPDNGAVLRTVLRTVLRAAVAGADAAFAAWVENGVSIVSTVVDRITPATTPDDVQAVHELSGVRDAVPVVTEPYTEWLLAGDFPGGLPNWERAGARFVDSVDGHQRRKLWLLNGAHSLLAYAGLGRGRGSVREAMDDAVLTGLVESWWDTAARHLPLPAAELGEYRAALRRRFESAGIEHRLRQIAMDGSQKIPARILPVLRAERAAGRLPEAAVAVLAAWIGHLRGADVRDPRADELVPPARSGARELLTALDAELASDDELVRAVDAEAGRFTGVP